jgi:hypothetical protein
MAPENPVRDLPEGAIYPSTLATRDVTAETAARTSFP